MRDLASASPSARVCRPAPPRSGGLDHRLLGSPPDFFPHGDALSGPIPSIRHIEKEMPNDISFSMERARGIGPPLQAWEARVLPLNYARVFGYWIIIPQSGRDFNGKSRQHGNTFCSEAAPLPLVSLPLRPGFAAADSAARTTTQTRSRIDGGAGFSI